MTTILYIWCVSIKFEFFCIKCAMKNPLINKNNILVIWLIKEKYLTFVMEILQLHLLSTTRVASSAQVKRINGVLFEELLICMVH